MSSTSSWSATIPPQQRFGVFGRSLLTGLGLPVENRFGLRPLARADGQPAPAEIDRDVDRLGLLAGVDALNLHPHLPDYRRPDGVENRLDVLARQAVDPNAPAHPLFEAGRRTFEAMLQSRGGAYPGTVLVGDATLFTSTNGGIGNLERFWRNLATRPSL